jgi:3-phenylpropionate/trans-cinnamate dioxygenase ferredoxin reductase subunit
MICMERPSDQRTVGEKQTFVIVGAGLAGAKAAEGLRTEGFDGRIVLIGEEAERPYERPPLSKDYLQDKSGKEEIYVHPEAWYGEHDVELRLGSRVTGLERSARQVILQAGERIGYDKLLLTTGSSPRRLRVPGSDLDGVLYLRKVQDCEAIKAAFASVRRVAIIGAGWIGLETAAAARAANVDVTLLETAKLPLLGVLGSELANVYAALHAEHGVDLRMGVEVAEIIGTDGRASGVRCADGSHIDADVVVVGVGITPNVELAEIGGLTIDNGIVVDEHLRSSDPRVFAAGDVANAYYPLLGRHVRLEHWSAALNQGPVAAANMVGRAPAYDQVPYFYSDQYDMKMEYWGYVEGGRYDEVVFRGDVAKREFIAFWVREGRVLAGMAVNVGDLGDAVPALVRSHIGVDAGRLADPNVALQELVDLEPPQR